MSKREKGRLALVPPDYSRIGGGGGAYEDNLALLSKTNYMVTFGGADWRKLLF
jgi:hypothetical protein